MLKKIRNLLLIVIGMMIALIMMFSAFIFAVIQTSERLDPITKRYGVVVEQTYEGWAEYNDYYIIQLENGEQYEIESDDLSPGDDVTVYFDHNTPIRTLYGRR